MSIYPPVRQRIPQLPTPACWRNIQGQVAEWLKAHAWNACRRGTVSRVRIPLCPPFSQPYLCIQVLSQDHRRKRANCAAISFWASLRICACLESSSFVISVIKTRKNIVARHGRRRLSAFTTSPRLANLTPPAFNHSIYAIDRSGKMRSSQASSCVGSSVPNSPRRTRDEKPWARDQTRISVPFAPSGPWDTGAQTRDKIP